MSDALHIELGPRGFQPIADTSFDEPGWQRKETTFSDFSWMIF
jgi:hypothetical protein